MMKKSKKMIMMQIEYIKERLADHLVMSEKSQAGLYVYIFISPKVVLKGVPEQVSSMKVGLKVWKASSASSYSCRQRPIL